MEIFQKIITISFIWTNQFIHQTSFCKNWPSISSLTSTFSIEIVDSICKHLSHNINFCVSCNEYNASFWHATIYFDVYLCILFCLVMRFGNDNKKSNFMFRTRFVFFLSFYTMTACYASTIFPCVGESRDSRVS